MSKQRCVGRDGVQTTQARGERARMGQEANDKQRGEWVMGVKSAWGRRNGRTSRDKVDKERYLK